MSAASYVELHTRSAFSFLEGASTPEQLIAAGAKWEMPALALLDRDGLYGARRFHLAAKRIGIKAHIGAEISVSLDDSPAAFVPRAELTENVLAAAAPAPRG